VARIFHIISVIGSLIYEVKCEMVSAGSEKWWHR